MPTLPSPAPRRLPSPWFTLLCALLASACLGLAYWQHQRAQLKQRLQDQADLRVAGTPLTGVDLDRPGSELTWQPARVSGSYEGAGQFLIDNRIHEHRVGFHVITPLQLPGNRWVLVNRGWLAAPTDRAAVRPPPAPAGTVTVTGLLAPDGSAAFELGQDHGAGGIWQQLKIARWAQQTGRNTVPAVLLAREPGEQLAAVAAAPDYRARTSRGYRLQWLGLALVAVGGWLAVALRHPAA